MYRSYRITASQTTKLIPSFFPIQTVDSGNRRRAMRNKSLADKKNRDVNNGKRFVSSEKCVSKFILINMNI
jgi:hypothetical protein